MGERFTSISSEVSDSELQNPPPFLLFIFIKKVISFSTHISISAYNEDLSVQRFDAHALKRVTMIE